MEPVCNDIDQPLGQKKAGRGALRWRRLETSSIFLTLCAVAVFAGSGAIALRERPFRNPPPVAISEPGIVVEEHADARSRADGISVKTAGAPGAAIIRVNPDVPSSGDNAIVIRDPSAFGQNPRFAHLPDRALIEESQTGPLPVRDAAGRRPFDVYARPWSGARGARIAIVIGGLGISQTGTQEAIRKLPPEITLAFAPLGNSLTRWMQTARQEGHEVMLQVPLEPFGYPNNNPGRHTLLADAAPAENLESLRWALSRITNYTGVVNYTGARFTADAGAMDILMGELAERGLAYLDDGTSARSVAEEVARAKGVPFAAGDTVIDEEKERGAILDKLDELERIARARGFALGSGSAMEATVDAVAAWASEVRKRGIELVPMSAVAVDPERN
ncbi:divergent polysaccharide deacetylase family protein [Chelativorans salis]|uniref:Divergent polysaccharide deacetylase family protein n=1 Tax=Chelativorans salis TaxID=2978478 RepID=A0ABT2LPC9_9HYPH|nr:divergent polysaccharide deacetylase family protein [Chelativorans sp. EGI FJ00035]MCT7376415.1 divergent polysaccharide deacetylase family protein [Chelativorans sp. EGI FJ00035]